MIARQTPLVLYKKQKGAILITTLILLAILTLIGVSSMDTSSLQLRMANNAAGYQTAFEAAESALRIVENEIENTTFTVGQLSGSDCSSGAPCFSANCNNGYCFNGSNVNDVNGGCLLNVPATELWEESNTWTNAGRHDTRAVDGVNVNFIVEFRCYIQSDPSAPLGSSNASQFFRVTTFAEVADGRGRAMIQSTYKK